MTRDELTLFLSEQTSLEKISERATLIAAPWGTGKTYFIKNFVKSIKQLRQKSSRSIAFVSLYGLSNRDQIISAIVLDRYLGSASTIFKGSIRFASMVSGVPFLKYITPLLEKMPISELNFRDSIVFIDDLERFSDSDISVVLGVVSEFLERNNNVILISNENELNRKNKDNFFLQKEKIVGRTIKFLPNAEQFIKEVAEKTRIQPIRKMLLSEKDAIRATVEAHPKGVNFRSFKSALEDFIEFYNKISCAQLIRSEVLGRILCEFVVIHNEYDAGCFDRATLDHIFGHEYIRYHDIYNSEEIKPKIKAFLDRYKHLSVDSFLLPPRMVAQLKTGGVFHGPDLANVCTNPIIIGKSPKKWQNLWWWRQKPQDQFQLLFEHFITEINMNALEHVGEALHCFGIALDLSDNGYDIDISAIEEKLTSITLELLKEENQIYFMIGGWYNNGGFAGLGYQARNNEKFQSFLERIRHEAYQSEAVFLKQVAGKVLSYLIESAYSHTMMIFIYEGVKPFPRVAQTPLLMYIPIEEMANLLIKDGLLRDDILDSFVRRAEYTASQTKFLQEKEWMLLLLSRLVCKSNLFEPPHKKMFGAELAKYKEKIEKTLS